MAIGLGTKQKRSRIAILDEKKIDKAAAARAGWGFKRGTAGVSVAKEGLMCVGSNHGWFLA